MVDIIRKKTLFYGLPYYMDWKQILEQMKYFREGVRVYRTDTGEEATMVCAIPFSDFPIRVKTDTGGVEDWYWYSGLFRVGLVDLFSKEGLGL